MLKRFLSFILALMIVSAPLFGGAGTVSAASTNDMEATIEKQIRAFADSIDKSNADDAAAAALAGHGIRGGGKKLSVGKSHALTATLFNSEMLQFTLTKGCSKVIRLMQSLNLSSVSCIDGGCNWYGTDSDCSLYAKLFEDTAYDVGSYALFLERPYSGKRNSYDDALDWMAAATNVTMKIDTVAITQTEATYKITCTISDRFDFSISSGSGFKDLMSGIGAVLFREFEWESTVSFQLDVPNTCTHQTRMYRWEFDGKEDLISISTEEIVFNSLKKKKGTAENGIFSDTLYYFDTTAVLRPDLPWSIEWKSSGAGQIYLSESTSHSNGVPFFT